MAQINIKIDLPDGQETALIEEFATALGWKDGVVTAGAFAKREIAGIVKETIKNYRITSAVNATKNTVNSQVESINIS